MKTQFFLTILRRVYHKRARELYLGVRELLFKKVFMLASSQSSTSQSKIRFRKTRQMTHVGRCFFDHVSLSWSRQLTQTACKYDQCTDSEKLASAKRTLLLRHDLKNKGLRQLFAEFFWIESNPKLLKKHLFVCVKLSIAMPQIVRVLVQCTHQWLLLYSKMAHFHFQHFSRFLKIRRHLSTFFFYKVVLIGSR